MIYRFSKEILAYIETLVVFSQLYRQNDPHTVGALGAFYSAALQDYAAWYAPIKYGDRHQHLTWRLMVWYNLFGREDPGNVADSLDTAKEGDVPVVMVVPVAPLGGGGRGLPRKNGGRGQPRRNRGRGPV